MEKTLVLKAEKRDRTGSKSAARLRKAGRIPAIVYGHKKEPVAISLDAHSFVEGLHHGRRLFDVQIGRKKQKLLLKDLQYDYLGKDVAHVDLMRVDVTEMVRVTVPVELKGTAKGTHEGGIMEGHVARLDVECKVTEIPESIVVSVKELGIGDTLHAKDIVLPEGVKLISDSSLLVAMCSVLAAAKSTEELEAETPVAPEVITEAKKGAEEEEGGKQEKSE